MVGSAETTVSPSSSSTRLSTPCVLGCCGPMLTVIVSLRSSGITKKWLRAQGSRLRAQGSKIRLDDFTHHVQQRPVDLLHACRVLVGHVDVHLGRRAYAAAV